MSDWPLDGFLVCGNSTALMERQSRRSLRLVRVEISNNAQYTTEVTHCVCCVIDVTGFDHVLYSDFNLERVGK
jgi:hypothetical protein